MKFPRLVIAGTSSGVGKTTISIGLMATFRREGFIVQPFKVGPDYIDPSYHTLVTGRPSRNLDTWMLKPSSLLWTFQRAADNVDLSIIEGVMGLYDGLGSTSDQGSTAYLAKLLDVPVLLVIDGQKLSRSGAAMVLGYQTFDPQCRLAGVIVNRVSGEAHFHLIEQAIRRYTDLPVVGFLQRDERIKAPERHLGLIPAEEDRSFLEFLDYLTDTITAQFNLEKIVRLAKSASSLPSPKPPLTGNPVAREKVRIGVARDEAFNFYYQDNLDLLEMLGAEVVYFSPLHDQTLPDQIKALYFGGGFPEVFADQLESNTSLRREIKEKIERGMPTYAECGGLMYLSETIEDLKGKSFEMAGLLPSHVKMTKRLQNFGYAEVRAAKETILAKEGERIRGHEFHYSVANGLLEAREEAYQVLPRRGKGTRLEGFARGNLLASYIHIHFLARPQWARRFIKKAAERERS